MPKDVLIVPRTEMEYSMGQLKVMENRLRDQISVIQLIQNLQTIVNKYDYYQILDK